MLARQELHQAGILIPKRDEILSFFPRLSVESKNPRVHLTFIDDVGIAWTFAFIYYNNAYFDGTRNEFRLTRMTEYIRQNNLRPGDELVLKRSSEEQLGLSCKRRESVLRDEKGVLRLGSSWKVIQLEEGQK